MTTIACTLTPGQFRERTAALADLGARAMVAHEAIAGGRRIRFADTADVERELRDAIAAEAACCAFLRMDLRREDGALVLDVTGPPDAQPIVAGLFG